MIKVRIEPNRMGHIHVYPTSQKVAKRVGKSNAYDGHSDIYLQTDYEIQAFLEYLRPSQRLNIEAGYSVTQLFDEWTFRHMVGGQSD